MSQRSFVDKDYSDIAMYACTFELYNSLGLETHTHMHANKKYYICRPQAGWLKISQILCQTL